MTALPAQATVMVISGTHDNPVSGSTGNFSTSANLETFVTATGQVVTSYLVPTSGASTNTAGDDYFWGAGEAAGAKPTSVIDALGTDLVDGILNPNTANEFGLLNLLFGSTIADGAGLAEVFIFNPDDSGTGPASEEWTIRAIVGGTASSPTLGGVALAFTGTSFGDLGFDGSHRRDSGANFTQNVKGIGFSISELGVSNLIGIQIQTPNTTGDGSGGDPSVVAAIIVPEPATVSLLSLGMLGLLRRRRRA